MAFGVRAEKHLPGAIRLAARWRRELHRIPELAFEEKKTAALIRKALSGMGLAVWKPLLGTDVVADLVIPGGKSRVAFRADIDGLPIPEKGAAAHRSRHTGFMHACGHDGHTAMLLATAWMLTRRRPDLRRNIRFIFQPAEELACGAEPLIRAGCLRGVDEVYALHGWPGLSLGKVSSRPGVLFAAGYFFRMEFFGRQAHGAYPEKGRNPLVAAGEIACGMEGLHRRWNRARGAVLSPCILQGGNAANVIPGSAVLEGTFRCLGAEDGPLLEKDLKGLALRICRARHITVRLTVNRKYRFPVISDPKCFRRVRDAAIELGPNQWCEAGTPSMASEDFAHMLRRVPGAMFRLGLGKRQPPLHAADFDFPDGALENGIRMFCSLATRE